MIADQSEYVRTLLIALRALLREQGETNWIRGVTAAIQELEDPDGWERARSIYSTMNQGNGSFSDYHVWKDNSDERIRTNAQLDELRQRLWSAFDL